MNSDKFGKMLMAYLPASLDKLLGIYLLARSALNLFVMNTVSNTILLTVGAVTIVLAVMIALVQHDMKRLLGFHAISQVGYMLIGIGTGNAIGIAGGIFHMFNNAVYKSCLFLGAGSVEKKTGTERRRAPALN
jgi:formate hydrogenlyase subunit 3/multisubunit Na+/H+ antiporter MnhD subunit